MGNGMIDGYLLTLHERMGELDLLIESIRKEKMKYLKACRMEAGISGGTLQEEKVMGGRLRLSFSDAMQRIENCNSAINQLIVEKNELIEKMNSIALFYKNKKTKEAQLFYYRKVLGYTQEMTAKRMGYSLRQIQRIEKNVNKQ